MAAYPPSLFRESDQHSFPLREVRRRIMTAWRSRRRAFLRGAEGGQPWNLLLIAPVLLLLILGIIDFGNLYYQNHMVNEAARAGARYATVDSNLASIPADVTNYINNNYDNNLTIHVSPSPPVSLQNVTVQVTNSANLITPIISAFSPSNPVAITGKCVMQLEN
jgi:Flp pilus assembly protein TadG